MAYAFTIHKAQGQTYDKVILDLNSHIFSPGQLYVALSRTKSLSGLYLTKPITYSDIISDESIFEFLGKLRSYNGQTESTLSKLQKPSVKKPNPICDKFSYCISTNETNETSKTFLQFTINCFEALLQNQEYEKAYWELQKIIDVICSTYQTDAHQKLIDCIRKEDFSEKGCLFALNAIFEIYTEVVKLPLRQYQSDNKVLTFKV